MQGYERRRAERHRVSFRLVFDDGGGFCMGTVLDLSATGMLVRVEGQKVAVGRAVRLTPVSEAGDILFDVEASVVRIGASEDTWCDVGLEFLVVDDRRVAALQRLSRDTPAPPRVTFAPPPLPRG